MHQSGIVLVGGDVQHHLWDQHDHMMPVLLRAYCSRPIQEEAKTLVGVVTLTIGEISSPQGSWPGFGRWRVRSRRSQPVSCPRSGPFSTRMILYVGVSSSSSKSLGLHGTPLGAWCLAGIRGEGIGSLVLFLE